MFAHSGSRPRSWRDQIVAASEPMRRLLHLVDRIAASTISVLVLGETGTGKEIISRAIHQLSGRAGPFVAVNCAALPTGLAETELFGHIRGSFTGAERPKAGLLEEAHRGTLLLDEIAELDPVIQAKLLRALEDNAVRRVGALATVDVDLRVIASTHRDLLSLVHQHRFREDLYYRLAGMTLYLAPLRSRPADIEPLALRFLREAAREREVRLAPGTLTWLKRQQWPGNVRELRQAVNRASLVGGNLLQPSDFQLPEGVELAGTCEPAWLEGKTWDDIERLVLHWALARYGSIRAASEALGRPRATIADRLRRLSLARKSVFLQKASREAPSAITLHEESATVTCQTTTDEDSTLEASAAGAGLAP